MSEEPKKTLRERVLGLIERRGVTMRPRWHFALRAALLVTGIVLATLSLLFVTSFIVFVLRANGAWFVPAFGYPGVRALMVSLPWLLIAVAVVFIVILEVLVKRYSFAYRRPFLYSVIGIILLASIGGFFVARTPFHGGMFRYARERRFPGAEPLYRGYGMRKLKDVHPGKVTELTNDGFRLLTRRDEDLAVIVSPETRFPYGTDIVVDDEVVVLGPRENGTVRALGIRRTTEDGFRGEPWPHERGRGSLPAFRCMDRSGSFPYSRP